MNDALIVWLVLAGFIALFAGVMSAASYNRYSVRDKDSRLFARAAVLSPLWPVAVLALIGWGVWHLPRAIKYAFGRPKARAGSGLDGFGEDYDYDEDGN